MVNVRDLDPSASPLDYYGSELRRLREDARLNQAQLGTSLFCTASLIGQIETAKKVPTRDFSNRVDAALGTDGVFARLVGLVLRSQLPSWFQAYAEMEARAEYISSYQAQLVYGLLQTEEYARAVLGVWKGDDLDVKVAARMERQRILVRENPPLMWVVMSEAVLHQEVGGRGSCETNSPACWTCRGSSGCRCRSCPSRRVRMRGSLGRSLSCDSTTTRTLSIPRTSCRGI